MNLIHRFDEAIRDMETERLVFSLTNLFISHSLNVLKMENTVYDIGLRLRLDAEPYLLEVSYLLQ